MADTEKSAPQTRPGAIARYAAGLSSPGLVGAGLFFSLSLAPSLVPRTAEIQAALAGVSAALGYGLGVGIAWLWRFLEIQVLAERRRPRVRRAVSTAMALFLLTSLWLTTDRQDALREFLGLDPLETLYTPLVALISLPLALLLRAAGRGLGWIVRTVASRMDRFLPRRLSLVVSVLLSAWVLVNVVSGTLGRGLIRTLDSTFVALDELIEDNVPPPPAGATGSPESLVSWKQLGRQGRRFIVGGPGRGEIAAFGSADAKQPLRVYVGLGAEETPEDRAALALAEMKRVGAFEREVLVVATPTGTGWVDHEAVDALEYLHRGDTAVVAQQYSYLSSYVSIFLEPGFAKASATALFEAVYGHWVGLPRDSRPRFYLQGLSLGSYASEQSMNLYRVLGDPIHGAVWSGPPFSSPDWAFFTRNRAPESPEWLPRFGDGSLVRFTNQDTAPDLPGASWGPMRLVYLQYASDPITFFSPDLFIREPAWLSGERGPDVFPKLRWVPVVTALQIAFDMIGASALGPGLGHLYAAEDYIDAWVAVTEPAGWTDAKLARLKAQFSD